MVKICKNMKIGKRLENGLGVGSGRVENDQCNCRNVFKQVLAKDSWEKTRKNMEIHDFPQD